MLFSLFPKIKYNSTHVYHTLTSLPMSSLNSKDPTKPTAGQNEDSKDNHSTDEKVDAQRANELQSEPTSLGRVNNENNHNDDKSRGKQKKNTEKKTAGQEQPLAMTLVEKTKLCAQSKMEQNADSTDGDQIAFQLVTRALEIVSEVRKNQEPNIAAVSNCGMLGKKTEFRERSKTEQNADTIDGIEQSFQLVTYALEIVSEGQKNQEPNTAMFNWVTVAFDTVNELRKEVRKNQEPNIAAVSNATSSFSPERQKMAHEIMLVDQKQISSNKIESKSATCVARKCSAVETVHVSHELRAKHACELTSRVRDISTHTSAHTARIEIRNPLALLEREVGQLKAQCYRYRELSLIFRGDKTRYRQKLIVAGSIRYYKDRVRERRLQLEPLEAWMTDQELDIYRALITPHEWEIPVKSLPLSTPAVRRATMGIRAVRRGLAARAAPQLRRRDRAAAAGASGRDRGLRVGRAPHPDGGRTPGGPGGPGGLGAPGGPGEGGPEGGGSRGHGESMVFPWELWLAPTLMAAWRYKDAVCRAVTTLNPHAVALSMMFAGIIYTTDNHAEAEDGDGDEETPSTLSNEMTAQQQQVQASVARANSAAAAINSSSSSGGGVNAALTSMEDLVDWDMVSDSMRALTAPSSEIKQQEQSVVDESNTDAAVTSTPAMDDHPARESSIRMERRPTFIHVDGVLVDNNPSTDADVTSTHHSQ